MAIADNEIQQVIARALNTSFPKHSAFRATTRDGIETVEVFEDDGDCTPHKLLFVIGIHPALG